jgi:outer membrane protein TolC
VHCEAFVRSVELRRQKWQIKRREMELIASKNYILPRLDAIGRYRWRGMGDHLIDPSGPDGDFNNAYQEMTEGDFQEWLLGLELSIPLGFRKEMAGIRHAQLSLARERAVYEDMELAVSNQLSEALRELEKNYSLAHTNFNKRLAALRMGTNVIVWALTH